MHMKPNFFMVYEAAKIRYDEILWVNLEPF